MRFFLPKYVLIILTITTIGSLYPKSEYELEIDPSLDLYEDIWGSGSPLIPSTTRSISPEDIILVLKLSGALSLLEEDFFNKTNNINVESLLDMAIYNNLIMFTTQKTLWSIGYFYNQTSQAQLTRNNVHVGSYLNLASPTILEKISNIFEEVKELLGEQFLHVDVPAVLCALANGNIQWRRTGLMQYGVYERNGYVFRWYLPFYWIERNFLLNECEINQLEKALGISINRDLSVFNLDPFIKDHFISDKLGFGDLRLSIEKELFESELYQYLINGGLYLTIPTACALGDGLLGRSFCSAEYMPNINFNQLFDLGTDYLNNPSQTAKDQISAQSADIMRTIFLDLFDRMAAALLTPQLGNGGHIGIGGFIRTCAPLSLLFKHEKATDILASSKIGLEYLFPAYEKRFFIRNKDQTGFRNRDFENPDQAIDNLQFIEQEILNRFFLLARKTCVHPGIIFTWTSKLMYEGSRWGWMLGSDTWLRTRESFSQPTCPRLCIADPSEAIGLDIKKNKPFMAYRSSIFAGIRYAWHDWGSEDNTWTISLNGDVAISTAGIGEDFSLFLKIEKGF